MLYFLEQLIAAIWNRLRGQGDKAREDGRGTFVLGFRVEDGQVTGRRIALSNVRRTTHLAVLGKTGTGKSSFLRNLSAQDIAAHRGFVYFDLHGDPSTPNSIFSVDFTLGAPQALWSPDGGTTWFSFGAGLGKPNLFAGFGGGGIVLAPSSPQVLLVASTTNSVLRFAVGP